MCWRCMCPIRGDLAEACGAIALQARASYYRAMDGALRFAGGTAVYALNERDSSFSADGLTLAPVDGLINDVTVVGAIEPQAYVKDYFVGDGADR